MTATRALSARVRSLGNGDGAPTVGDRPRKTKNVGQEPV